MPVWRKVIVSGSQAHLLNVTSSGYLATAAANTVGFIGTASWAAQASTASFLTPGTYSITASFATTASYVTGSVFGSSNPALSSSFALTASYVASAGTLSNSLTNSTGIQSFSFNGSSAQTVAISQSMNVNTYAKWTGAAFTSSLVSDDGTTVFVNGNLNVKGNTVTVDTENLLVSDRFILVASSSAAVPSANGGLIVQNAANFTGSAFYYDGDDTRWALTPVLAATATSATANSYMVTVSGSTNTGVAPSGNPQYGGASVAGGAFGGAGSMFVNVADGDIWIYT